LEEKIMIVGSGLTAQSLAEAIVSKGIPVIIACRDTQTAGVIANNFKESQPSLLEIFSGAVIESCIGKIDGFSIELVSGRSKINCQVTDVILAEEAERESNVGKYSLETLPQSMTLSEMLLIIENPAVLENKLSTVKTSVFLNGVLGESHPEITREVMNAALFLQTRFQIQSYVFTNNLKVAGDGLEALSRETRMAGVIYTKGCGNSIIIEKTDEGPIRLTYFDESTRSSFSLVTDLLVIDEKAIPSAQIETTAEHLRLEVDSSGFAQGENVHRLPILTNRKRVLVVGHSRGALSKRELEADKKSALLALQKPSGDSISEHETAWIHERKCIRCLTCFRVCPYAAVVLTPRPVVAINRCEGCGICVVECPRSAIDLERSAKQTAPLILSESPFSIVAFCCRRSAAPALELANLMGHPSPGGFSVIEVPCGGKVSHKDILNTFQNGADGVMVITCHPGNCHSEKGARLAKERVENLKSFLKGSGIGAERLIYGTVASNMGSEASYLIRSFDTVLHSLGRSPLKQDTSVP
jgi:coenzyme F420-reducing hydrogenase delta subunit/Pyruvate/2-oxoacid:ferredoxin oxidoreductase delta subunit